MWDRSGVPRVSSSWPVVGAPQAWVPGTVGHRVQGCPAGDLQLPAPREPGHVVQGWPTGDLQLPAPGEPQPHTFVPSLNGGPQYFPFCSWAPRLILQVCV